MIICLYRPKMQNSEITNNNIYVYTHAITRPPKSDPKIKEKGTVGVPEMLEDEVYEESNVEAFVVGRDNYTVLVLVDFHSLFLSFFSKNPILLYCTICMNS